MNAFSLSFLSNFAGVICGYNYNAVYWGLYFVSDTVTPTNPWLEPLVSLHLVVLHTSL